jgi:uncharacterized protein (DUF2336 family)
MNDEATRTGAGGADITYDQAKEMARADDVRVRCELAGRNDVRPEILYFLAEDPDPEVRRAIAANAATPHHADLILASDGDVDVRSTLAGKIAALAPSLTGDQRGKVSEMAFEAMMLLARDEVVRVRRVLSETLQDMTDAPPEVILKLARDAELAVSGPVLEFSPVLTDDDLLSIIESELPRGALGAIAKRAGLGQGPAHAIAETLDEQAVAELLGNESAQIREETLDLIIDHAPEFESWHAPLVERPVLPAQAIRRISEFVAANMLEVLENRDDLDMETAALVREEVERRLADGEGETPDSRARALFDDGSLDGDAVAEALEAGDRAFVKAALALLSDLPADVIDKAVSTGSVKGTVALAWKAGLSPRLATDLQMKLSFVPAPDVLHPKGGEDYPLSDQDMEWQLDFLKG